MLKFQWDLVAVCKLLIQEAVCHEFEAFGFSCSCIPVQWLYMISSELVVVRTSWQL